MGNCQRRISEQKSTNPRQLRPTAVSRLETLATLTQVNKASAIATKSPSLKRPTPPPIAPMSSRGQYFEFEASFQTPDIMNYDDFEFLGYGLDCKLIDIGKLSLFVSMFNEYRLECDHLTVSVIHRQCQRRGLESTIFLTYSQAFLCIPIPFVLNPTPTFLLRGSNLQFSTRDFSWGYLIQFSIGFYHGKNLQFIRSKLNVLLIQSQLRIRIRRRECFLRRM